MKIVKAYYSNKTSETVKGKHYQECQEKVIQKMKLEKIKKAYIVLSSRIDTILQDGVSWHWDHKGFFFNTTGGGLGRARLLLEADRLNLEFSLMVEL